LDSAASFEPKLEVREDSVNDVLISGPEKRSNFRSIFGLFNSGVFIGIFGVGIISVSPFVLPTKIVGVAVVVAYFIILDGVQKTFH
jgi:hypothetical protein